jgi:hypothetical protein
MRIHFSFFHHDNNLDKEMNGLAMLKEKKLNIIFLFFFFSIFLSFAYSCL